MREDLSAWMDSELDGAPAQGMLAQIKREPKLRQDWDCYHLIGDALRGTHGSDLCARVHARLEAEPTVLAPRRRGTNGRRVGAALSLAASLAAVAFVGWVALGGNQNTEAPAIATAPVPAPTVQVVAVPAGAGAKDYLLAHQRYSPSNAMQGVASYVRTVADERSARR